MPVVTGYRHTLARMHHLVYIGTNQVFGNPFPLCMLEIYVVKETTYISLISPFHFLVFDYSFFSLNLNFNETPATAM